MIAEKGKEREILIVIQPRIWKKHTEGISEPNKGSEDQEFII